ncbi:MAG: hypothetical protein IAE87_03850 [Rhodobacteraceae bacterium]|jgi:hypothetical protein|nr:hypothetical protein [Paracoccaceae bacterium]
MHRIVPAALAILVALWPALAGAGVSPLSAEIRKTGIAATQARLAALPAPVPEELFALAGLRFLGGVEKALQLRWETGVSADWSELPILRLPIPARADPRPFRGSDLMQLLTGFDAAMIDARSTLDTLGARDFALEIDLGDLWFDIDANGIPGPGESLAEVAGTALGAGGGGTPGGPLVRFDSADAAWLSAYTHLLQGVTSAARAYSPYAAVDRMLDATAAMQELQAGHPPNTAWDMLFGRQVDRVAIILTALAQKPDPALARQAHGHFLAMIAENRRFWTLVAAETDNAQEWVPNDAQTSALGLRMPPGTGTRWLAVLGEAEQLLNGEVLAPHWRMGSGAGIDVKALFEDPPAIDPVAMIQGEGLLPYARKGSVMSLDAWADFSRLVEGDALLYAAFLN